MDPSLLDLARETFARHLDTLDRVLDYAARHLGAEARAERVAEGIALCWRWWRSCVARQRSPWRWATGLARHAALATAAGRRCTGTPTSIDTDPAPIRSGRHLPPRAQRVDLVLHDLPSAPSLDPARVVQVRLDVVTWLGERTAAQRRYIDVLAGGCSTTEAATVLGVHATAVSEMRRYLAGSWRALS